MCSDSTPGSGPGFAEGSRGHAVGLVGVLFTHESP